MQSAEGTVELAQNASLLPLPGGLIDAAGTAAPGPACYAQLHGMEPAVTAERASHSRSPSNALLAMPSGCAGCTSPGEECTTPPLQSTNSASSRAMTSVESSLEADRRDPRCRLWWPPTNLPPISPQPTPPRRQQAIHGESHARLWWP